jgi:hypothetical protein
MSVAYYQDEGNFIADKVFPVLMVDKQTDIYARYNKDAWYRDQGERMRRAPGTIAARSGWTIDSNDSYRCLNEAIGTEIPDELRSNADMVYNLDADATRFVTNAQLIRRERLFASNFMATGKWTTDKTGASDFTKWSDYANSDPFGDMETFRNTMRLLIGRMPNKLVMGYTVWKTLKHHPDFIDRIKGGATTGSPALFTKEMLAAWWEIDEILIEMALYNTAAEKPDGSGATLTDVFSNSALLLYVPNAPSLLTPAAGYTFVWKPLTNGGAIQYIRKYRDDPAKKDVVEAYSYFTHKMTAPDAGLFIATPT